MIEPRQSTTVPNVSKTSALTFRGFGAGEFGPAAMTLDRVRPEPDSAVIPPSAKGTAKKSRLCIEAPPVCAVGCGRSEPILTEPPGRVSRPTRTGNADIGLRDRGLSFGEVSDFEV